MKNSITSLIALALTLPLSACVESPDAPPQASASALPAARRPLPPPVIRPVAIAPPVATASDNWTDWPITPGDWRYRADATGSVAAFGLAGAEPQFSIRCETAQRQITLTRAGRFPAGETGRMTVRATSGLQTYSVANSTDGAPLVVAKLPASEPQLDAVIYSRGRFLVSVKGGTDIVIPNWAEFARVVEDCR
jgi:hypothetical protein